MDKKQHTFNEYQLAARETAVFPDLGRGVYPALGLSGETGELIAKLLTYSAELSAAVGRVSELVKKHHRDLSSFHTTREAVKKELGDVQWYVSTVADEFMIDLQDVADSNIEKLAARKAAGTLQGSGDNR